MGARRWPVECRSDLGTRAFRWVISVCSQAKCITSSRWNPAEISKREPNSDYQSILLKPMKRSAVAYYHRIAELRSQRRNMVRAGRSGKRPSPALFSSSARTHAAPLRHVPTIDSSSASLALRGARKPPPSARCAEWSASSWSVASTNSESNSGLMRRSAITGGPVHPQGAARSRRRGPIANSTEVATSGCFPSEPEKDRVLHLPCVSERHYGNSE